MDNRKSKFGIIAKATCGCNLNCEYCYDAKNRKHFGNMVASKEVIAHTAKLISEHTQNCGWLWHGGEPTVIPVEWYREIQDVFAKHYNTVFDQTLQSNGVKFLRDRELLYSLQDMGIGCGASFDVFTQSSRLGINSEKIMNDYCDLLIDMHNEENQIISALTVVTTKNIEKLIDMYEFFKSKFVGYSYALSLLYVSQYQDEEKNLEIPPDMLLENLRRFYGYMFYDTSSDASYDNDMMRLIYSIMYQNRNGSCHQGDCRKTRIGLHPNGDVLYCDTAFEKFPLGNIMEYSSIEEIFNSENYIALSEQIQSRYDNECSRCHYYEICGGDCHHQHMSTTGDINKCNQHLCNQLKNRYALVYSLLQSVDESTKLNHKFSKLFENGESLLPLEIERFLANKDITIRMRLTDKELSELGATPQFKLFRLFTSVKQGKSLTLFSHDREELFNKFYEENSTQIGELLNELKEVLH